MNRTLGRKKKEWQIDKETFPQNSKNANNQEFPIERISEKKKKNLPMPMKGTKSSTVT